MKRRSHYTCCKLKDFGEQKHWSNMDLQMVIKIEAFSVQGVMFWDFYGFRQACLFFTFLGTGKRRAPKTRKTNYLAQGHVQTMIIGECHNPGWTTKLRCLPFWLILLSFVWQRPTQAGVGRVWRPWMLKGSSNRQFSYPINIKWTKMVTRSGARQINKFIN